MRGVLPLFYQSGYLTIKGCDPTFDVYTLGIPNEEVRIGLSRAFLPFYVTQDVLAADSACLSISKALMSGDLEGALKSAKSFFASIPYQEGTLKDAPSTEGHFTAMLYVMFSFLNNYVFSQVRTAKGRLDILIKTPAVIYVLELKLDGNADEALKQIEEKGYAIPYEADGRKIVKAGIVFSSRERTITQWKTE